MSSGRESISPRQNRSEIVMIVCTTWKARPLSPEQSKRMMEVWAKLEAKEAADTNAERLGWYMAADGSGGVTIVKYVDPDTAAVNGLEVSLAFGEFLELESKVVLELDSAMPAIVAAMEYLP